MKILFVITKAELGGAQNFVLGLAGNLKLTNQDVVVASGVGEYLPQELKKKGIPFLRLKNLKRNSSFLSIFYFIFELRYVLKKENFEVIHLNSTNTLPGVFSILFLKKKPKIIFTFHGMSVLDSKYKALPIAKFVFRLYFKFFLKYVNEVVFVCKQNLAEAIKQKIILKGEVIYNGLEITGDHFFSKEEARSKLGSIIKRDLEKKCLIGSIGRLAYPKNYDFLINNFLEILKIMPNAKLIIIGEGSEREKYEKLIEKMDLKECVFLPGELKNASRFLKGFDLFVLSSIYEGLSISLIESVLAGVPVLASNVGGNEEIVTKENCFELNNSSEFLGKIISLKPIFMNKDSCSFEKMTKEYFDLYKDR